jgi:glutamate/tyrosine decarboxylase-like PLP-dependent enzyme
MMPYRPLLDRVHDAALRFLDGLPERPVTGAATFAELRAALGGPWPDTPQDPQSLLDSLQRAAEGGIVSTAGPRYFGFVTGGSFPVAVAADWLVSSWDQNTALHVMSPAASAIEDVAAGWVLDALSLPRTASVGFVTGAHMANVTALAAARHEMLRREGWDVEAKGLQGAPALTVFASDEAHSSIGAACRFVGLGAETIVRVRADGQGRMRPSALADAMHPVKGACIVCAQAGNVNTGACDSFPEIVRIAHERNAWVHVDGAFGLWAAAASARRHLVEGVEMADSWTTDGHKWLNVPYDSGIVIVAHPAAHRAAMSQTAAYLTPAEGAERDGMDWTPEASRRARAVPVYAVLKTLGRSGLADLVERCCGLASRFAERLRREPGVTILNDVVLNQVLVRFTEPHAGANITARVIALIQGDRTCWCGGTMWDGGPAMRISVSNWRTSDADIDRSTAAILTAHRRLNRQ